MAHNNGGQKHGKASEIEATIAAIHAYQSTPEAKIAWARNLAVKAQWLAANGLSNGHIYIPSHPAYNDAGSATAQAKTAAPPSRTGAGFVRQQKPNFPIPPV